jgi:hypothetical protein
MFQVQSKLFRSQMIDEVHPIQGIDDVPDYLIEYGPEKGFRGVKMSVLDNLKYKRI